MKTAIKPMKTAIAKVMIVRICMRDAPPRASLAQAKLSEAENKRK